MKGLSPTLASAEGLRLAMVVSRFNGALTEQLRAGAEQAIRERHGRLETNAVFTVPGAFEIPVVADAAARSGRYDGVLTLGAVIQGETPHFEYICEQTARGIMTVSLTTGVPVIFGVLTCATVAQAHERAAIDGMNKGSEFAQSLIETIMTLRQVRGTAN